MEATKSTWDELVEKGRENQSHPEINVLDKDDITSVIATMEYFGATLICLQQSYHDLLVPKFRVFDWLAMNVNGRMDDDTEQNTNAFKVLIHAFRTAGYNEKKFIENIRVYDYEIMREWEEVKIN